MPDDLQKVSSARLGDDFAELAQPDPAAFAAGARRGLHNPLHRQIVRQLASLIETCKLNDVEPQAHFAHVLAKLVNLWPASRIDELMPWAWAAARRSTDRLAA